MNSIKSAEFKLKGFKNELRVTRMANLHYFEFIKEYHTVKDKHPFRELVYVDSGSINVQSESFCGTLGAKQLLIHKNNNVHSLSCLQNNAPNVIIIGFECECERLDFFADKAYTLSNDLIKILIEVIKEGRSVFLPPYDIPYIKDMKKRKTDVPFGADQMLRLKFETFLIELIRSTETPVTHTDSFVENSKIEEIFTYVNNNYNQKITLDDLCFLFGTNKTTICQSFKNTYGESLINYVNRLRIKNAKKLMREGKLNLTQLSLEVGFSSIHYFSKIFKAYEKKSPSEYMKGIKSKFDM